MSAKKKTPQKKSGRKILEIQFSDENYDDSVSKLTQTPHGTVRKSRASITKTKKKLSTPKRKSTTKTATRKKGSSKSRPPKAPKSAKKSSKKTADKSEESSPTAPRLSEEGTILKGLRINPSLGTLAREGWENDVYPSAVPRTSMDNARDSVLKILHEINSFSHDRLHISFVNLLILVISSLALITSVISIILINYPSSNGSHGSYHNNGIKQTIKWTGLGHNDTMSFNDKIQIIDDMIGSLENTQSTQISNFQARMKELESTINHHKASLSSEMEAKISKAILLANQEKTDQLSQLQQQMDDVLSTLSTHNQVSHDNAKQLEQALSQLSNMKLQLRTELNNKIASLAANITQIDSQLLAKISNVSSQQHDHDGNITLKNSEFEQELNVLMASLNNNKGLINANIDRLNEISNKITDMTLENGNDIGNIRIEIASLKAELMSELENKMENENNQLRKSSVQQQSNLHVLEQVIPQWEQNMKDILLKVEKYDKIMANIEDMIEQNVLYYIENIENKFTEFEQIVTEKAISKSIDEVCDMLDNELKEISMAQTSDIQAQLSNEHIMENSNNATLTRILVDSTYDPTHKIDFTAKVIDNSEVMTTGSKFQQYLIKIIDKVVGAYQQPIKAVTRAGDCLPLRQPELTDGRSLENEYDDDDDGNDIDNKYDSRQDVYLTISLYVPIVVTEITIEHISHELSLDWKSAPKDFIVYGSNDKYFKHDIFVLGTDTFDDNGPTLQTFSMIKTQKMFKYVKIVIQNNYGANYTCLYRIRVHGKPDIN